MLLSNSRTDTVLPLMNKGSRQTEFGPTGLGNYQSVDSVPGRSRSWVTEVFLTSKAAGVEGDWVCHEGTSLVTVRLQLIQPGHQFEFVVGLVGGPGAVYIICDKPGETSGFRGHALPAHSL